MGSKTKLWVGRVFSAVVVLFLLMDSVIHMLAIPAVVEAFHQLGYPLHLAFGLGLLELICIAIYLVPRTSVLGAILLTGYLGGATAAHVRIESPLFGFVLFPTYLALLMWGGLTLRDDRLRGLFFASPRGASGSAR